MQLRFAAPLAVATFLIQIAAAAPTPVGKWTGRLQLTDTSRIPPAQRARVLANIAKTKISLVFKSNHTCVASVSGAPAGHNNQNGTWSQSGNTVSITESGHTQKLTLAKGGHELAGGMGMVRVIFTR